jgi:hypothetical protein
VANPQANEVRRLIRVGLPLVLTFASDWGLVTTATIASSWISASAVAAVGLWGCGAYLYTGDVDGSILLRDTLRADSDHCRSLGLW